MRTRSCTAPRQHRSAASCTTPKDQTRTAGSNKRVNQRGADALTFKALRSVNTVRAVGNRQAPQLLRRGLRNCNHQSYNQSSLLHSAPTEKRSEFRKKVSEGPSLSQFINQQEGAKQDKTSDASLEPTPTSLSSSPSFQLNPFPGAGKRVFIETYGCQMNESDSEIIRAIMKNAGYENTEDSTMADVILLNTCAIRDNAEAKVWTRLRELKSFRNKIRKERKVHVGVLGCMAERLKEKLLETEQLVDVVVGPDEYRSLPHLVRDVADGSGPSMAVQLSLDETYADLMPVRTGTNLSAYVSIMRGCNNMCSYCIVPFTRGRERSRPSSSIVDEVKHIRDQGFKEIVLLGQNVNSYSVTPSQAASTSLSEDPKQILSRGFKTIYKLKNMDNYRFGDLLHDVAEVDGEMRVRFTSPHPKDFPDDVLEMIAHKDNICKSIHIPAQSGSSAVLERMRRGYTREAYSELVALMKKKIPGVALSSDFISGFCGETEEDHLQTLSLLREIEYDFAFMFAYSLREKTHAHRHYQDDVPQDVKIRRLKEVIDTFHSITKLKNQSEVGKYHLVLVEGESRRKSTDWCGRSDTNKRVIFAKQQVKSDLTNPTSSLIDYNVGDYVIVKIDSASNISLKGTPIARSSIREFNTLMRSDALPTLSSSLLSSTPWNHAPTPTVMPSLHQPQQHAP